MQSRLSVMSLSHNFAPISSSIFDDCLPHSQLRSYITSLFDAQSEIHLTELRKLCAESIPHVFTEDQFLLAVQSLTHPVRGNPSQRALKPGGIAQ